VRYLYNEQILRKGISRFPYFGEGGGIVYPFADVDAFSGARFAQAPARPRIRPRTDQDQDRIFELPADGPPPGSANADQSLNPSRSAPDDEMADFSIRMNNRLRFSSCEAPHIPVTKPHEETLAVELRGDLLTITDGGFGSRIYARRAVELPQASLFTILPELPSHVRDGSFFPALGTVAILAACCGEQRRLRAVGTDRNSGQCHGWIFDAIEEGGPGPTR
jgi:hypothetical protein